MTLKFQAFECQENIFKKVKVLNSEIDRVNFLSEKSKQIFSQKINNFRLKFRLMFNIN